MQQISVRVIYSHQDDFLSLSGFTARGPVHHAAVQPSLFYFADMSEMLRPDTLRIFAFPPVPAHSVSQRRVRASARLYAETSLLQSIYLKEVPVAIQT